MLFAKKSNYHKIFYITALPSADLNRELNAQRFKLRMSRESLTPDNLLITIMCTCFSTKHNSERINKNMRGKNQTCNLNKNLHVY